MKEYCNQGSDIMNEKNKTLEKGAFRAAVR